jgi:hypothetical protein
MIISASQHLMDRGSKSAVSPQRTVPHLAGALGADVLRQLLRDRDERFDAEVKGLAAVAEPKSEIQ